jgi:glucose-6-phosphate isomerase
MWTELQQKAAQLGQRLILDLFAASDRAKQFSVTTSGLLLDYSKTQLDEETRQMLLDLAAQAQVGARRDQMFVGEKINETEDRAVLHTALRRFSEGEVSFEGHDVLPEVRATRSRMAELAQELRGSSIRHVVNIGIGGSDLGPVMAVRALAPYHDGPRCHFVSNVDGADLADTLAQCDPQSTLFIVASKSFTTIETMTNAFSAKAWLQAAGVDCSDRFVALSTDVSKAQEFGIPADRVFGFEDWVGGRYSVWGPIGLSLMIAIGPENVEQFLRGGHAMDLHFQQADLIDNMPVMLALVGLWHHQVLGYGTRAVLPYDNRLGRLPAYLQQLEMESNGKGVSMCGQDLPYASGPVVWGEPGTNGQHAFYQMIHQGTAVIPCEFLLAAQGHEPDMAHHHQLLIANCLAQSEALMKGRTLDEARAKVADRFSGDELERQARHRVFPGNRPSTTLIYPKLTPFVLGQIVALYEHRVFVEGVILGINSFDQWGVELGKELATALGPVISGEAEGADKDGSTQALVAYVKAHQSGE